MKYEITIKDLETGEVTVCNQGDAIVGGIAYKDPESSGGIKGHAFVVLAGTPTIGLGAIDFAENAGKELKKELMNDFIIGLADQIKEDRREND